MFLVKAILVAGLLAGGAFFLLNGLGVDIPFIKYKGAEGRDLPAGVVLFLFGALLAIFWKVSETSTTEESSTSGPGGTFKFTKKTKSEKKGIT